MTSPVTGPLCGAVEVGFTCAENPMQLVFTIVQFSSASFVQIVCSRTSSHKAESFVCRHILLYIYVLVENEAAPSYIL